MRKYHFIIHIFLIFALIGVFCVTPRSTGGNDARLHPVLAQAAARDPGQTLRVIVQSTGAAGQARQQAIDLGGRITKDLSIIHAFAAEMTAGAVAKLAGSPAVRWISPDSIVVNTGQPCPDCINPYRLLDPVDRAIGADTIWNESPAYLQGQGVTVAVVDSGIWEGHPDLSNAAGQSRVIASVEVSSASDNLLDQYGHGTHIAGIIGGNGIMRNYGYIGVAPKVNLISVKVTDENGAALTSDVVAGLQWVYDNRDTYNIRVVNLSMNSTQAESYQVSPLDAALEILWFDGIVVVVSSGNNSQGGVLYPPANDPFVMVVGAIDNHHTVSVADDTLATYSAFGTNELGINKPDLVAPGTDITSLLSSDQATLAVEHPLNVVNGLCNHRGCDYFRMSGTSMASAVAAGAAALLIQDEPGLNPDQVKYRLMATARPWGAGTGAGYLDVAAAVHGDTTATANTGIPASPLLWTGEDPITWDSVNWGSVNWGSVNWGSVNWGSVNWGSVNWGSDYWGP